ncbi:MAG TPA: VWA domain-containing protein [Terriglobales bacterium]|nr:VWA domain-containing protein [Terriglobales bacterium]
MLLLICSARGQSSGDGPILPRDGSSSVRLAADSLPTGRTPASRGIQPLRVDVNLVLVPVTVSDSMNHTVATLKKEDFALYEDNKRQEIRSFSTEDVPISVAILVDVSKSMSDKIDAERAGIVEFFNNANPDDEYFAIAFSDRPRLLSDSTQSVDEIQGRLLAEEPGGPTAMLDAVYLAVSKLRSARYERKAILILSDGGDNASQYTLREIKSLVQESDVQIFAVGLFETSFFNTFEEKLGKIWLSEITDATGGHTITVENRDRISEAAATISRAMRNEYVLGYRPGNLAKTKWRKIKVRLTSPDEPPLHAYYRQGYSTMH